jgi:putative ABC transport system ATP-binding protein
MQARARILLTWTEVDAAVYQYVAVWNFMAFALHAEALWKLYESGESVIQAVQDVSLSIEQGSMVAIMGPSGCGKTTLLNVLSGIDEPNSGTVLINGENLYGSSDDERTRVRGKHMGFIFQEFNLLPVMTALENVELPLLIQGKPANEVRKEAKKALTAVGLGDRLEHRPAELSGGQQQRVAIARAVVHRPAIVLCDEPTGNLDAETSSSIIQLLRTLCRVGNTTFLIVTHDESIAQQCDSIRRMSDGRFLQDVVEEE